MKNQDKHIARSYYDQKKWICCVWVKRFNQYVPISASPIFNDPEKAILWGQQNHNF